MTDATGHDSLARFVAAALARHRDCAPFVRLLAAELPPRERRSWLRLADALASGDVTAATKAAAANTACWIPLFASPAGDPRLPARMLQTATRGPDDPRPGWPTFVYPAVVTMVALAALAFLSPMFRSLFEDFGMSLPLLTRWLLAIGAFSATVWKPALVVVGIALIGWWISGRRRRRHPAAAASFTRAVARLVAAGVQAEEAVAIAGHGVVASPPDIGRPRPPLGYAAAAALEFAPRPAALLLDAVADCHEDRARGVLGTDEWLAGPLTTLTLALVVGFVVVAFLAPLVRLIQNLS